MTATTRHARVATGRPARPPRVLHVAHHALPHVGGLEAVVEAETVRLASRGWQVTVLSSATGTNPGEELRDGVRRVRLRAWNGLEDRFGVPFPVFTPRLVAACLREVRRADVVHVHDALYLSSWVAAACCWLLRRPYVVHRHVGFVHHSSAVVRLLQRLVLATVARAVLDRAALVVAIDDFVAAGVRRSLTDPARLRVVRNGVDTARFRPPEPAERARLRAELGLPVDEPLVLFVGRFVPKKGFPLVAAAAGDRYRLVFCGGQRPAGVDDPRLVFLGTLPQERMAAAYRCADAYVGASVGECPLTVLEALASGLPVVLAEDPALRSPWTEGPGVRFAGRRPEALVAALEQLLADPGAARESGRAASRRVRVAFSWDAHVERLEELYLEAAPRLHPGDRQLTGS